MAVVGSTWEELFYRGFLIGLLGPAFGVLPAVLLSSTVFGFGHAYQGWFGVVRTAIIGLALAVAFVLTNSLWWLIGAHVVFNLSGGLFAWSLSPARRSCAAGGSSRPIVRARRTSPS
jgi:membrane protease YdiL (CAAX protease family)